MLPFHELSAAGRDLDLLTVLDALVKRDGSPPGITGRVCVGVRGAPERQRWWIAELGTEAKTRFSHTLPPDVDAAVLFDESTASAVMFDEPAFELEGGETFVYGDIGILRRVLDRYLVSRRALDVRTRGV